MKPLVGLLLLFLKACHGAEKLCEGKQNGTNCYGPLGGAVAIKLRDSFSDVFRYEWKKNQRTVQIFLGRKNAIDKINGSRFVFTPHNGTILVKNLTRMDSATYILETFNEDTGKVSVTRTHLIVQAPVSSVLLATECLPQGAMKVSCSPGGGDSPTYIWTLNGQADAKLFSVSNETNNITLEQNVSGKLVCTVQNQISKVSNTLTISSTCGLTLLNWTTLNKTDTLKCLHNISESICDERTPTSTSNTENKDNLLIMAGILSALLILVVVGAAVVCAHRRKARDEGTNEEVEEELTYADVTIKQRKAKPTPKEAEMAVEYGQVKFSKRSAKVVEVPEDMCVYSNVRRGR
ncbi:uncharacterized protein ACBR49_007615 [Aulostomus maculatus]